MKLTKDFYLREFESHDGAATPEWAKDNLKRLSENLQVLRDYVNQPIHISSGYRSTTHNQRIGGVKNSYHTKGKAADITIKDYNPKEVANIIIKLICKGHMRQGGIGLYNGFVHYDIRGYKARWDNSTKHNF